MTEFFVGQELFVSRSRQSALRATELVPVRIEKIARKWIYLSGLYHGSRFDKETRELDGGGFASPGKIYVSQKEYDDAIAKQEAWERLRKATFFSRVPRHLTIEFIEATIAELER